MYGAALIDTNDYMFNISGLLYSDHCISSIAL